MEQPFLSCGHCLFGDLIIVDMVEMDENEYQTPHLICRRYPPQNTLAPEEKGGGTMSMFPLVHDTDWCGEFVEKTTKGE